LRSAAATLPPETTAPQAVPGYVIEAEVGRGGMGVVYKARQLSLNRIVALKMILHAEHASEDERLRFRREAEALAKLRHENVVQVYEVGEHQGKPFFSLEYVDGGGLHQHLEATPLPPAEAARLVETLARAMHAAHEAGLVHRDLKPANILLAVSDASQKRSSEERFCEASLTGRVPKITDFGLAKDVRESGQTRSGELLGTPSYMAPEQAAGRVREVDRRADVYALGAILYECLTGRPPFKAATTFETLQQVLADEPVPLRRLQPGTPRDLETVCLRCLEKAPARRYSTALELADELGRFLRGEPVRVRPVSAPERAWRWCKRNPVVAGLLAALVLVFVSGFGLVLWKWRDAVDQKRQAQQAEASAAENAEKEKKARRQLEVNGYFTNVSLAHREWLAGNPGRAEQLLADCPADLRRWEWHYLQRLCHAEFLTLASGSSAVTCVAYNRDGSRLASGSADGTVRVWEAKTGTELQTFRAHNEPVAAVAFSPNGKFLAAAACAPGLRGEVKLLNTDSGEVLRQFARGAGVRGIAFDSAGKQLASAGEDGLLRVWDVGTGKELRRLKGHRGVVMSVAFFGQGWLVSAGADGSVRLWARTADTPDRILRDHADLVRCVAVSPDGDHLASAGWDRLVKVWDLSKEGEEPLTLSGHGHRVESIAFSPDGKYLVSASEDRTVKLWDAKTGEEVRSYRGHAGGVRGVAFSPDGKRLASAGDATVRLWDAAGEAKPVALRGRQENLHALAFSPDGKILAAAGADGTVQFRDGLSDQPTRSFLKHTARVTSIAFSPDGKRLASAGFDQTVKVWDPTNGKDLLTLSGHTDQVSSVVYSPDGKLLASAGGDQSIRLWDAQSGRVLRKLPGHGQALVSRLAFSPDSKRLASAGYDRTVKIWDAETGKALLALTGHGGWIHGLAFSPDGKMIASGSSDNTLRLWDAAGGKELRMLTGHTGAVWSVAFSPDGRRLASASLDQTVKLWEPETGREILTLSGHGAGVAGVTFAPGGWRLASVDAAGSVSLWDGTPRQPPPGQSALRPAAPALTADPLALSTRQEEEQARSLRARLDRPVNAEQIDDPAATLDMVLDVQRKNYDLDLAVDEEAFRRAGVDNPRKRPVRLARMMDTSVESVFWLMLSNLGASYVRRGSLLVVTTRQQALLERGIADETSNEGVRLTDLLPPSTADSEKRSQQLRQRLVKAIHFAGIDDPKATAVEVLDYLGKTSGLSFVLDLEAFRQAGHSDIERLEVVKDLPIPGLGKVSIHTILMQFLERFDGAYLVHRELVVVTSRSNVASRAETDPGHWFLRTWTENQAEKIRQRLAKSVRCPALDDPKITLPEAISLAGQEIGVPIALDTRAFQPARDPAGIQLGNTVVPAMQDVSGDMLLRRTLAPFKATYVIRGELLAVVPLEGTGPDSPAWLAHALDGFAHAREFDWDKAADAYSKALSLKPDEAWLRAERQLAYARLGQWDKAAAELARLIDPTTGEFRPPGALPGGPPAPWFLRACRGKVFAGLTIWDKAAAGFAEALALRKDRGWIWAQRGWAFSRQKHWDRAIADFSQALERQPDDTLVRHGRAYAHLQLRHWPEAVADLSKVVEREPALLAAWLDRSWAYSELRQWDRAVADASKAIALSPNNSAAWQARARVYRVQRLWEKALPDLAEAIKRDRGQWGLWLDRGNVHAELGRWPEAVQDFAQAVDLAGRWPGTFPQGARVWGCLALARLQTGAADGYRKTCADLLKRFGQAKDAPNANSVAWTCALAPDAVADLAPAVRLAEKAVAATPGKHATLNTLGAILYRAGRFEEAVKRLDEARKIDKQGGSVTDWLFLALAHQRLKHTDEAKRCLGKAVALMDRAGGKGTPPLNWQDKVTRQLLRREATMLVGPGRAP
jgi:WD40 repeat protein/tetratricopeptide (TPR) repeat protein/tRNA A-37 threonylcarbamoyl transferase component Bud32